MSKLPSIRELDDLSGKTVIVAINLDVPLKQEKVLSNYRIKKAIPTIEYLQSKNARIVLIAHLGRPEGQYEDDKSLMPVRFELGQLSNQHIKFAHIPSSRNSIIFMEDGEILLLENARFNPEELSAKASERKKFVEELAELADYYVFDAFASYRKSASTYDLPKMIGKCYVGLLVEEELEALDILKENPEQPYVAVIGGAKLDTKIPLFKSLITKADKILIGGAMAYTFLSAKGIEVGESKIEKDKVSDAKKILAEAKKAGCEIMLPVDHIGAKEFSEDSEPINIDTQQIPKGVIGMDIGERTMDDYQQVIENARTILWNGPMGVFEWDNFSRGTEAIGEYIGLSASKDVYKVAGGGDTISAMQNLKINFKNYRHVSTGGGAMLAYLAGEKLPNIENLKK